ncbi:unnamed protein product [Caenorhabditis sp. 36 PRJEB53466]|nr:unnamed protein product [Caenorhabditis sp. 36 PRJEB53466]
MHSSENSTPNSSTDSPFKLKTPKVTPPEITAIDVWFHGELSEHDANHLLQNTTAGAFLVRQTSPTRFYLSIVDSDGYPKHMPIRLLTSPHYMFEGKRYDTLRDVVDDYKPAVYPIGKGEMTSLKRIMNNEFFLCMKSFEGTEIDEMSAEVGDVLTLCDSNEPGWMIGKNETNESSGIIRSSHVEPLITVVDDITELPYFYDSVSSEMVLYSPIGTFLLRRSSKGADTYALLVKTQFDVIEKFLIVGSPAKGFNLAGRPFPTIGHVLTRYCNRAIAGRVRLTHAVCIKQNRKPSSCRSIADGRWAAPMSSSQYEDVKEKTKEKSRRMFRGASIDTALASSSFLTNSSMPSPSNTFSTGIPEHFQDRFTDDDSHDHLETSRTAVASTVALRKSREEKQWKDCWLTLSDLPGGFSQLSVSDSIGSKLRQQVDLSACTMFWLDESVFSVDGCLFLSSFTQQPALFLCFRPFTTFLKWVRMLRSRTIYQDVPPALIQGSVSFIDPNSQVSLLSVEIDKFRSETFKQDMMYSANVLLNGVKVASSSSFAPTGNRSANELPVVVIDSKFIVPSIPTCTSNVQLSIIGHSSTGKKGRPCGVSVSVCLHEWNEIVNQNPSDSGFVFRVQRIQSPVLSIERYRSLLEAMRESPSALFSWPSQVLPQHLKVFMYSCVSHLYALNPNYFSPLIRCVIRDVLATSTPEDVFRKDSLATGIITQCLRHLFKTPFDEFLQENSAFSQAIKQQTNLDAAVELLVSFVDQRLMTIPLATRLLVIASECAQERFGDEPHLVKRTLSALLILRVLNPIIFSTLNTGIGSQIAKSVQICANLAASQSTSDSLSPAAVTIRRIFDRMIILVEQKQIEFDDESLPEVDVHTEWLSWLAYLIGHSLTLRTSVTAAPLSTMTSEEMHSRMPLAVLELVRLHQ